MRLTVRKTLQAAILFGCLLFFNSVYVFIIHTDKHSFTSRGVELAEDPSAQNGDRPFRKLSNKDSSDYLAADSVDKSRVADLLYLSENSDKTVDRSKRSLKYRGDDQKLLSGLKESLRHVFHPTPEAPTPRYRTTDLDDIFISVKTTQKYHKSRLDVILDTWHIFAMDQTYFFTDVDDPELQKRTRGHAVNTNCSATHARGSLCCKMSVEYDTFMASGKRWFCHVDDDTYVNVPSLLTLLRAYNHTEDWYLGKPSLNHPIEKRDLKNKEQKTLFWFATGGAGFCISRAMGLKMMPYAAGGKLWTVCNKIRLPDDCTIGFIIYYYVKRQLTVIPSFHSHLEGLWHIRRDELEKQITFSYSTMSQNRSNVVLNVDVFNRTYDPTRFRSIHCTLYPNLPGCPFRPRKWQDRRRM